MSTPDAKASLLSTTEPVREQMKKLSNLFYRDQDYFLDNMKVDTIIFDESDDVTIWAYTEQPTNSGKLATFFFHLGLPFEQLDVLLRHMGRFGKEAVLTIGATLAERTEWPYVMHIGREGFGEVRIDEDLLLRVRPCVTYSGGEHRADPENIFYLQGVYGKKS